jgi:hypothetical protein
VSVDLDLHRANNEVRATVVDQLRLLEMFDQQIAPLDAAVKAEA